MGNFGKQNRGFQRAASGHWIHLKTTNPIESTLATLRLRQWVKKGAGSREAGLGMVYKLLDAAQDRWRRVNAPYLVARVRTGAKFIDDKLQERTAQIIEKRVRLTFSINFVHNFGRQ